MFDAISQLASSESFMPHGHCFLWTPPLLWSYVVFDGAIALSYFSIPAALWYFARNKRDLPFRWVFVVFGVFVLACGTSHLFAIWTIWNPDYWMDASIKGVTAFASVFTAIALWPMMPHALAMPTHSDLGDLNRQLEAEVERRRHFENALLEANSALKLRVSESAGQLEKTEGDLAMTASHLEIAITSARLAVFDWNLASNAIAWHGDPDSIFGFDAAEFPHTYAELEARMHPADVPGFHDELERCLNRRVWIGCEVRVRWSNGDDHWVSIGAHYDYDEQGAAQNLRGAMFDITARKDLESALSRSERRFRSLVENATDLVVLVDGAGQINYVSPSVKAIAGYDAAEIVGTNFNEYVHPDDRAGAANTLTALTARPTETITSDLRYRHKNGEWLELESVARNLIDDPSVRGIIVNARDVTDRMKAERSLRRVNRALKTLSAGNVTLIHASDESALLHDMCRNIVEAGGYLLAWVGIADDDDAKTVRPVAYAGYQPGFMEQASVTWADGEQGSGPVGRAIREREPQVVQDALTDPMLAPWRNNALHIGYRSVIALPLVSLGRTLGALSVYSKELGAFDSEEIELLRELANDLAFGITTLRTRVAQEQSAERLLRSMEGTIESMAATVEMRDAYTSGHQRRVAKLAVAIAKRLGLTEETVKGIYLAAIVHDLGKIQIPAEILSKPGRLSPIEIELIKTHPQAGYDILKGVDFPWPIAQAVLQHHERLDGSGYPQGLKSPDILLEAKILAVADTVEAMTSHRPYRPGLGIDPALKEVMKFAGTKYDGAIVDACMLQLREDPGTLEM